MDERKQEMPSVMVRLDPETHQAFRRATFDHGIPMQQVLEAAVKAYLMERRVEVKATEAPAPAP